MFEITEDAMDKNLVQALRARGIDVMTAFEAGMIERPDEEHLKYATKEGREISVVIIFRGQSLSQKAYIFLRQVALRKSSNHPPRP